MAKQGKLERVEVSLPKALLDFVQRTADAEDRTVSGTIRRFIAEASARETPLEPKLSWPVRLPTKLNTPEEVASAERHLGTLERERDQLDAIRAPYLMPEQATRLSFLHGEIAMVSREIWLRKRADMNNGAQHNG